MASRRPASPYLSEPRVQYGDFARSDSSERKSENVCVTVNRAAPGGDNNLRSLTVRPALGPRLCCGHDELHGQRRDLGYQCHGDRTTSRRRGTVSINSQPTISQSVAFGAAGSNTSIQVEVTAPNGSQKTYVVTVNRAAPGGNNNLQSLTVTPGPLVPAFAAGTTSYTVDVAIRSPMSQ